MGPSGHYGGKQPSLDSELDAGQDSDIGSDVESVVNDDDNDWDKAPNKGAQSRNIGFFDDDDDLDDDSNLNRPFKSMNISPPQYMSSPAYATPPAVVNGPPPYVPQGMGTGNRLCVVRIQVLLVSGSRFSLPPIVGLPPKASLFARG
jgi:hypothetical protein